MITFEVPGEPRGKGRPRFSSYGGRVHTRTPDETVLYENQIKFAYKQATNRFFESGRPLMLTIYAIQAVPKSASKKKQAAMLDGLIRPTKKPDWDNIGKVVCDALNGIAYADDTQIVDGRVVKKFGERPRLVIMLDELVYG